MAQEMTLYSYYRSSASYRVRIALNLKGIPYETVAVHLLEGGGQQHGDEYRALNPMRQVPTLVHDGKSISQSLAIVEYLEDIHPENSLYPKDPYTKAKCLQLMEIINSGIQPLQNLSVMKMLEADLGATPEQKQAWLSHWVNKGFLSIETVLKETAGSFCCGDEVTAADAFLIPQVFSGARFGVTTENYPTMARVYDKCMSLETFQKAAPENQPDTPKD